MTRWGARGRCYRRPYVRLAWRRKFVVYPLLAIAALAWLGWDWSHARNLAAAADAIFDTVIGLRRSEPLPAGRVAGAETADGSFGYYRGKGERGWPRTRTSTSERPAAHAAPHGRAGGHRNTKR